MKKVEFTSLHLGYFGKHTSLDSKLGHRVLISGQNMSGKSTIKRAIQYILGTKDESGKEISGIRPHDENGVDIDGLTTVAELTVSVDGQENTLKRTCFQEKNRQGEYTGKDNLQYFVDDVKKGTKKAYEEFVSGFLPNMVCISAQEFLSKDTAGRREMLSVFSEHDNDSVIDENPEFEPLRAKVKANSVADLKKACRDKIKTQTKERDAYPARIDELERQKVDIDVAELELLKNSLNEQISANKAKQADISKQFEEIDRQTDGIIELKCELSDLERKANEENNKKKRDLDTLIVITQESIGDLEEQIDRGNKHIQNLENRIKNMKLEIMSCREKWKSANERVFDENSLICPYCGQEYPTDKKEQLRADFESHKQKEIAEITEKGNGLKADIDKCNAEIEQIQSAIAENSKALEKRKAECEKTDKERVELPVSIDISDREDVKAIKAQIAEKEQAMSKGNTASEMREELVYEENNLRNQLLKAESQISLAQKNVEIDERVAQLQKEQRELSQKITSIEGELSLLKDFERKKAELLESDVNKHFEFVKFKMFEKQVTSDDLRDVCQILSDGESYDRNLNFSNKILAEIDICRGFQRHYGIVVPILVDNVESIDPIRIPQIENQIIMFKRDDNPKLTIEVTNYK